jgi:transcriptional regulator with XRE-family HTH domain
MHYQHFAVPNLYLANGYREMRDGDVVLREFEREDDLENAIRRILIRKSGRLSGWDMRFLRRGLNLTQADVGRFVDRDAQTIARWEKSRESVPTFLDLSIRARFAARFDPGMSIEELLSYVDARGPHWPNRIVLTFANSRWSFNLQSWITSLYATARTSNVLGLPVMPRQYGTFLEIDAAISDIQSDISGRETMRLEEIHRLDISDYSNLFVGRMTSQPRYLPQSPTLEGQIDDSTFIHH